MTARRIEVDIFDLEDGKLAYFTKHFVTYRVKLVELSGEKAIIEVVEMVLIHKNAMERKGLKRPLFLYRTGIRLSTKLEKLWEIEQEPTLWERLKDWLESKIKKQKTSQREIEKN